MNKRLGVVVIMLLLISGILTASVLREQLSNVFAGGFINKKQPNDLKIIKVAVILNMMGDPYTENVRKSLERIQAENPNKVKFEFYYSQNDQDTQNRIVNKVIDEGIDLLAIKMVDTRETSVVANRIKETNTPVVFFSREPLSLVPIRSYSKSLFIGTRGLEGGILQGKAIINEWNNNKYRMDKNKDEVLQYIMLTGQEYNKEAIERTKYSIETVNKAGIKTEELALRVCDYREDLAKKAVQALLFKFGDNIEAVIANNDAMAIGAIKALQEAGFNKGDENKTIPVFGIDAIDEAKELIAKGFMAGTVVQDDYEMAKAIYLTGINLVAKRPPLEGTPYVFDESMAAIRIPYKEYKVDN